MLVVENKVDIPNYMQPSLLKAADAQHCMAEGFVELMAVPKTEAATPPPPPPRHMLPAAKVATLVASTPAPIEEPQLTWEEAANVIAAVRS